MKESIFHDKLFLFPETRMDEDFCINFARFAIIDDTALYVLEEQFFLDLEAFKKGKLIPFPVDRRKK